MNFPIKPISNLEDLMLYEDTLLSLMQSHLSSKDISQALLTTEPVLNEYAFTHYSLDFESLLVAYTSRSKALILSKQQEVALSGSEKMLIFLGKNYAQQVDDATKVSLVQAEQVVFKDSASVSEPKLHIEEEIN